MTNFKESRMTRWASVCAAGVVLGAWTVTAQPLPVATPEAVGVSSARLERLHSGMQDFITRKEAGGIVTLLARDGKLIDLKAYGSQDVESNKPMKTDTIFRIASMTKPVTSVAVMMLVEEGRLALTDPVSKYIPAFRETRVAVKGDGTTVTFEPVRRQMTVRDLLTHRSGLSYGFADSGPVGEAYRRGSVSDGLTVTEGTIADNVERMAKAPLLSQPGAEWHYSLGIDVLGRLVEIASGMPFDVFLRDRIFTPLKMVDTAFDVPDAKWARFATVYSPDGNGGIRPMKDPEQFGNTSMSPVQYYKAPKRYFSGGAGLASTASDYVRFAQMLLNGGELDGVRLLSPKTVDAMRVSHTEDLHGVEGGPGSGFGLGFRVVTDLGDSQMNGSVGMYGWSGIYGTNFWIDPKEKLVAIMMVQKYPNPTVAPLFQTLTYQAILGPPQPLPAGRTISGRLRQTSAAPGPAPRASASR
ncbi:MAG: beta-lactamase family protein [Acidimicrobiia bacterium]|nr:beta-lactamase family protein [Acidimicrobiia bacterium]